MFFTRYSAVMVLLINGNINFECGQDLYDDMDLEAPPKSWDELGRRSRRGQ